MGNEINFSILSPSACRPNVQVTKERNLYTDFTQKHGFSKFTGRILGVCLNLIQNLLARDHYISELGELLRISSPPSFHGL